MTRFSEKVFSREALAFRVGEIRSSGGRVGFTNGCFDIIHPGHVRYLKKARLECDALVVGVNSDRSVKALKGPSRPLNDEFSRCEVLAALECVDLVTVFDEDTPRELITRIMPDMLFKGGDWKESEIAGAAEVKSNGGRVLIIPYEDGFSTTNIISRMKG